MAATLRIELFPDDLDALVDFYVSVLGFRLVEERRRTDDPYAALVHGDVRLGLARRPEVDEQQRLDRAPEVGVELVLEVDDLDDAHFQVAARGWPLLEDITSRKWGLRDFRLLDPSGYYWRLTTREPEA